MIRLLLLSNSTMPGTNFFTWPQQWVKRFLGKDSKQLIFIPFAGITISWDEYSSKVETVYKEMGYSIKSIHKVNDKTQAIRDADAIIVGGGNTFGLLSNLYNEDLLEVIRERVFNGIPYIGWSAGSNIACPTIMTTNDMPVVAPPSFNALNLVPFQINPHYHELKFANQGGETRRERLEEFIAVNPARKVLGLPEGMLIQREGDKLSLQGEGIARLYEFHKPIVDIKAGEDISYLLEL
ncbi:dipeptidase PepE [Chryseosolibacter indicus]|uniref:Dipeptidase PepE n=1 Tax=Chryseosolibacter indicus TaxID=2782351 RepID=A0ABS5VLF4_9BACT|nr:dipeptidase PepE [Chryseosolibacter indicus]MBT1702272.1 dipeptidase PepE [Chryseosolibacter indicus]